MFIATSALRLLLVEDHRATREALTMLLAKHGYRPTVAANAREARLLADTNLFDVVLCDIGLPDEDGYSLMTALKRAQPALKGIAITAYDTEEDLARCNRAGFSVHLVKPLIFSRLAHVLSNMFSRSPDGPDE